MRLIVNRRARIIPDIITLVKRGLQGDGKIFSQVGQSLSPHDVVGRSEVSPGFRSINLSNALSVSPKDVKKYLQRAVGKVIYKGELLAYKTGGFFGGEKIVIAPTDGILEVLSEKTGILRLKILPSKMDIPAAVFGIVERVDHKDKEVEIKTQVSRIFGLVGSGKPREGYLKILGSRGDLVGKNRVTANLNGRILVGGGLIYRQALKDAIAFGVNGIITGGINLSDFKSMSGGKVTMKNTFEGDVGIGILVTEGFGSLPIGQDIFEELQKYNDKFVILEGNQSRLSLPSENEDCIEKIRRIQSPPNQNLVSSEFIKAEELIVGKKVRIIGSAYMGEQGQVDAIDKVTTLLPSQVATYMVTVSTSSRKIRTPYNNLEIIG